MLESYTSSFMFYPLPRTVPGRESTILCSVKIEMNILTGKPFLLLLEICVRRPRKTHVWEEEDADVIQIKEAVKSG